MSLMSHLPDDQRARVEARLRHNLIAWLTTVRPTGLPDSVPVWFLLQEDETLLIYSRPDKRKLRNIADNPHVALGLDVTDLGRDIVRVRGTAERVTGLPGAHHQPAYVAKYQERIAAMFGTPERFAELFSETIVITPTALNT